MVASQRDTLVSSPDSACSRSRAYAPCRGLIHGVERNVGDRVVARHVLVALELGLEHLEESDALHPDSGRWRTAHVPVRRSRSTRSCPAIGPTLPDLPEKPLQDARALRTARGQEPSCGLGEVDQDRPRLSERQSARHPVVDDRGDLAVPIDRPIPGLILLVLLEIDVVHDVLHAGLGQHDTDLPAVPAENLRCVVVDHEASLDGDGTVGRKRPYGNFDSGMCLCNDARHGLGRRPIVLGRDAQRDAGTGLCAARHQPFDGVAAPRGVASANQGAVVRSLARRLCPHRGRRGVLRARSAWKPSFSG